MVARIIDTLLKTLSHCQFNNMSEELNPIDDKLVEGLAITDSVEEEAPKVDPMGRTNNVPSNGFYWGTGRRKNAVARVRVRPGKGQFIVNDRPLDTYFARGIDQATCQGPLVTLKALKKVDVIVQAHGGGNTGQAGAVRMGLARALFACYPDAHAALSEADHFTRDPRMVERKKYGRHGARRGHQWGKR